MRVVPRWALASAVAAPILLIGGWTLGAARQPGGFDQVTDTISALAAVDATDRWIMTLGLAGLGLCHCVTAAGLRPLAPAGRALLALGGVGTLAVAAFPLPAGGGDSVPHKLAATVAFGALALWPALAAPRTTTTSGRARRRAPWAALTVGLALPVAWFVAELATGGERIGLAERVAAGAEALAPLLVVAGLRTASGRRRQRGTAARRPTALR
ncbi:DUF998 domain-containing protein [Micromonospora maris]|uniref:DUF998 domain-containing protein n=1 Tax=Micromonospora maris TaxID=1003110 RepID=UPI002E1158B5|nr:DUF998 domain-containing protein [Micromonospora maris]